MTLYKVQTGAFAIKRNAEKQAAKVIAKLGIRTTIVREGLIYKVQCGAFSQYGNAVTMANRLRGAGFKTLIMCDDVVEFLRFPDSVDYDPAAGSGQDQYEGSACDPCFFLCFLSLHGSSRTN